MRRDGDRRHGQRPARRADAHRRAARHGDGHARGHARSPAPSTAASSAAPRRTRCSSLLHALASLHDDHGDVAVAGLRREEWTGESYSDDEFRELAEVLPGLPLIGTGGLGSRVWSGPAITVTGHRRAVRRRTRSTPSRRTRARSSTCACIPSRTPPRRRPRSSRHLRGACGRSGSRSRSSAGRDRQRLRRRHDRPGLRGGARRDGRPPGGRAPVSAAGGGSIPLVSALAGARRRTPRSCSSAPPTATRTSTRPTSACCSTSSRRRSPPRPRSSASSPRAGAERDGRHRRPAGTAAEHTFMAAAARRHRARSATRCRTRRSCSSGSASA